MIKNEPTDIKQRQEKYYGIYRGVVEDNNDGNHEDGRVQIRVWGVHTKQTNKTEIEGIPTIDLPWAQPAYPIVEGSISGIGLWSIPVQGTHVFLFFENGDHMQPRYFACAPGIQPTEVNFNRSEADVGFKDPDEIYPLTSLMDQADMNRLARGETDLTAIESIALQKTVDGLSDTYEPDNSYAAVYPHDMVLETPGGHVIELDSTPDNKRMLVYHPSNTYMEINDDGRMIDKVVDDRHEITIENRTVYIGINDTHSVLGDRKEEIDGSWLMDSDAGMTLTDNGIITAQVGGSSIVIIPANITICSTTVYIGTKVYLGGCAGAGKALATADHVHCGVQKGNDCTGPPDDITTNTFAV